MIEVLRVVDDPHFVGSRATDAGQTNVLLLDLLLTEDLLHVHVDFTLEEDGCAIRAGTGAAREGPLAPQRPRGCTRPR